MEANNQDENTKKKSGVVAIVGRPNVGKSTLMNKIIGQKIAITSPKPQTTRNRIQTVYTCDRGQIVFQDTPGIHKSRNKLGDYMVGTAVNAIRDVDLILWLIEPVSTLGRGEDILERLKQVKGIPIVLVINKIDTVKKEALLEIIDSYRTLLDFRDIVPVSARNGQQVEELIDVILDILPEGEYLYDEDTVTDQPMRQIAAEIIREKALRTLDEEIPHGIAVEIDSFKWNKTSWNIQATIVCEKDSHKGIIIGKNGSSLKKIGTMARMDIEKLTEEKVFLELWVKVKRDWRESDMLLKNYGYNPADLK